MNQVKHKTNVQNKLALFVTQLLRPIYKLYDFFHSISSATLENWPEISEKLFHRLEEVLVAKSLSAVEVRKVLFDLKSRTKLQMFLEIVQSLHTVKQIPSDNNSTSLANDEYDTVKRMRCDIGQMLVANGLQSDTVKQAVEDLEHIVLNETLENVKLVFNLLEDIRMHEQKDLLIKFKVTGGQKKSIVSFIADALNKGEYACTF